MFILLALFREVTTLYRSANAGLHPTAEVWKVKPEYNRYTQSGKLSVEFEQLCNIFESAS